jgi:hypothetical protein
MQELSFVIFQIDQARRYIAEEEVEGLRLALVLLDNAIELQLERRIQSDSLLERLRESSFWMRQQMPPERQEALNPEDDGWEPLTLGEKRAIQRYFDPKVKYLSERQNYFDSNIALVLRHLHSYRNEAYHRGTVRRETILTADKILLELNCLLLESLPISSMSGGYRNETWVERQFGVRSGMGLMGDQPEQLNRIIETLRADMLESPEDVASVLADHLDSRLEEFSELLDYVADNTRLQDTEEVFRFLQFGADVDAGRVNPRTDFDKYRPDLDLTFVDGLQSRVPELRTVHDRVGAFAAFASIEQDLEPHENELIELVHKVDDWINAEIDRRRGK